MLPALSGSFSNLEWQRFTYLHTPWCPPVEQSPLDTFQSNDPCASKNQACTLCRSLCWSRPHNHLSCTLWRNERQMSIRRKEKTSSAEDWKLGEDISVREESRHFDVLWSFSLKGSEIFQCSFFWHACWARECGMWVFRAALNSKDVMTSGMRNYLIMTPSQTKGKQNISASKKTALKQKLCFHLAYCLRRRRHILLASLTRI